MSRGSRSTLRSPQDGDKKTENRATYDTCHAFENNVSLYRFWNLQNSVLQWLITPCPSSCCPSEILFCRQVERTIQNHSYSLSFLLDPSFMLKSYWWGSGYVGGPQDFIVSTSPLWTNWGFGTWLGLGLGFGLTIWYLSFPKSTIKTECQVICSEPNILTFLTQEISFKFLSC